jgi:FKBP-type peptidyl-prolyl cis-trans isomerase FkpA
MKRLFLAVAATVALAACSKRVPEPGESTFKPAPPTPVDPGPASLQIIDDVVGTGKTANDGDTVRVHYTGTLMNGTKFDSSRDKGVPFEFKLGTSAVIKGWDQGVVGMKVGGKRRLVIPQAMGYGAMGSPPNIPPSAGLKFEIELLDVNPKTPLPAASAAAPPKPNFDVDPTEEEAPPEEETP